MVATGVANGVLNALEEFGNVRTFEILRRGRRIRRVHFKYPSGKRALDYESDRNESEDR
jgi:hypothetical protein